MRVIPRRANRLHSPGCSSQPDIATLVVHPYVLGPKDTLAACTQSRDLQRTGQRGPARAAHCRASDCFARFPSCISLHERHSRTRRMYQHHACKGSRGSPYQVSPGTGLPPSRSPSLANCLCIKSLPTFPTWLSLKDGMSATVGGVSAPRTPECRASRGCCLGVKMVKKQPRGVA